MQTPRPLTHALWMAALTLLLAGCCCHAPVDERDASAQAPDAPVAAVVPATEELLAAASDISEPVRRLIDAARPTIGTPYVWGGADLSAGVDCSNYTWLIHRDMGLPYRRYRNTKALSTHIRGNGLTAVPFDQARPGDLLVYGYTGDDGRWRGHVVILIDPTGEATGYPGLALGSHGAPADGVQFITYLGYDAGYYKQPFRELVNVLRVDPADG